MPTAVNATDSAASTAPRPPGVGTADPKVLASRKMNVVSRIAATPLTNEEPATAALEGIFVFELNET